MIFLCIEYSAHIRIPIDTKRNGIWYMERKFDATMPNPPNVDMRRKPNEEQLAQVLDKIPNVDPENNDLLIFNFECFSM